MQSKYQSSFPHLWRCLLLIPTWRVGFIVQFKPGTFAIPQLQQLEDLRSALWGPEFSYGHSVWHHPFYRLFTYTAELLGTFSEGARLKTQPKKAQQKKNNPKRITEVYKANTL